MGHLRSLLGSGHDGVTLVARERNAAESHYASEVVTCGWPEGRTARLLVKYGDGDDNDTMGSGLRAGPAYEALVYQEVLVPLGMNVPRCFGSWREATEGIDVLVLEFLDGVYANRTTDRVEGMSMAARWIGHLHALAEPAAAAGTLPPLNVGMSRPLLKFGGGSGEILRDVRL